ncbi:MAG: CocE/NonD family hydrolase, partial [Acidimicrobiales bacterium]
VLALAVLAAACSSSDDGAEPPSTSDSITTPSSTGSEATSDSDPDAPSINTATVRSSVERIIVSDLAAGVAVSATLDGETWAGVTDENGAHVFRDLTAGDYDVSVDGNADVATVRAMSVDESLPEQDFYAGQTLAEGYQYIEMRDGTTLAASVYLPPGDGPFPTVVEYSGYSPARPGADFIDAVAGLGIDDPEALCDTTPIICNSPDQSGSLFAYAMDFAVVAVNMRGTGCSGGAFGYFDVAQRLDGYDIIETVAAQPWVKNNHVGMVGLSYPGISQLFVAGEAPPGLAAITPFSVFDDVARDVVAPGGVFNTGFAGAYSESIDGSTAAYGQGWEQTQVDAGDTVCEQNQLLRGQNIDLLEQASSNRYYPPELADPLHVETFADQIEVPVMLAGAWQDAQVGPGGLDLADEFVNAPVVKVLASNGSHADPWALETVVEWKTFLDLYVNGERRPIPPLIAGFFPTLLDDALFKVVAPLPAEDPIEGTGDEQRAAYEAEPDYTYFFERGGDVELPGAPVARHTHTADQWLSANSEVATFYLGNDGTASQTEPTNTDGATPFALDASLAELTTLPGENPTTSVEFVALPPFQWEYEPDGSAAVFVSEPLADDLVWLGDAAANLWIRSNVAQADLSVTVSEVRPDGQEMYIQSGFLRAEMRERGDDATITDPDLEGLEADAAPLPVDEWVEVSIPLALTGHIVRAGSQLRFSFHTPGGDRPTWSFAVDPIDEGATVEIAHSADRPSSVSLVVDSTVTGYPSDLPACPGVRGQACRPHQP